MSLPIKALLNNEESQKQVREVAISINECLEIRDGNVNANTIMAAYALYKARISDNPFSVAYQDIVDGKLNIDNGTMNAVRFAIHEEAWVKLATLLPQYAPDIFAATVFLPIHENAASAFFSAPPSIIKLAQAIFRRTPGNRIADICCGTGSFLVSAALEEPNAQYTGYEINVERHNVSKLRAELLGADMELHLQDAFSISNADGTMENFDKVFANYPFGLKIRNLGGGTDYLNRLRRLCPEISKGTSCDWAFNALLCDIVKDNGKAIGIMTNGSTWNSIDMPIRKCFIERGMVECVISMPNKMFSTTNISTSLIVLSQGNQGVRLIDATNICKKGRRQNEFSAKDIQTIVNALTTDSEYSKTVSLSELRENEYSLNLSRYQDVEKMKFENGVPFQDVIKRITRGAPCTARQLDEMVSDSVTNVQYLMLSNIQDGMIEGELPYLVHLDAKLEKYCLKNNDLILSKTGYPYKVAIAQVQDGRTILANGNLYVIEIDKEKANPYYLQAFFESDYGAAALKNITVGTAIPNIGVDKLKKLLIPLPSMEEQNQVAQKYQATLDEIAFLKLKLEKAVSHLHHIFDMESER